MSLAVIVFFRTDLIGVEDGARWRLHETGLGAGVEERTALAAGVKGGGVGEREE